MKTTLTRTVGMALIAVCLLGTTAFADTGSQGSIETVIIEACSAKEVVGEYPSNISQNHKDKLDGLLGRIDIYNAAGDYETVNKLWNIVDEILGSYKNTNSSTQAQGGDYMTFDDFIKNYAPNLSQSDQNILRNYFDNVISAYKTGDQQLIQQADQTFFAVLDSMVNNKLNSIKPDYVKGSKSSEDDWEAPVGQDPDAGNNPNPVDPDAGDDFDQILNDLPHDLDQMVRIHIQELIDEIRHFESVGNFTLADQLRNELVQILDVISSQEDPCFDPDMM